MDRILRVFLALLFGILVSGNAYALTITLESDGNTLEFQELTAGSMNVQTSIGDWNSVVVNASSTPVLGSNFEPDMTFNSIDVSSNSANPTSLSITLTETFADAQDLSTIGSFLFLSGSRLAPSGTAQYIVKFDNGDEVYNQTFYDLSFTADTAGITLPAFQAYDDGNADGFTVQITMILTHSSGPDYSNLGTTIDSAAPVPVPAAFSLLSMGLLAFVGIYRRK